MKLLSEGEFDDFTRMIFGLELPPEERTELFKYYLQIVREFEVASGMLDSSKEPPLTFKCSD